MTDVRRLADRVVPHRVGREEVETGLAVVAPVRIDVRVDDGADALRCDHAPGAGVGCSLEAILLVGIAAPASER